MSIPSLPGHYPGWESRIAPGDERLSKAQFEDREIERARARFLADDRPIDVALPEFEGRVDEVMRGVSMPFGYLEACAREDVDSDV